MELLYAEWMTQNIATCYCLLLYLHSACTYVSLCMRVYACVCVDYLSSLERFSKLELPLMIDCSASSHGYIIHLHTNHAWYTFFFYAGGRVSCEVDQPQCVYISNTVRVAIKVHYSISINVRVIPVTDSCAHYCPIHKSTS